MAFSRHQSLPMKLLCVLAVLYGMIVAVHIPVKGDRTTSQPPDLESNLIASNASLVDEFSDDLEYALPGISPQMDQKPMHWAVPHYFKRQNCQGNRNFCYPGINNVWCSCSQICCYDTTGKRYCCPTGFTCDLPRSQCIEAIATITIASTTYSTTYYTRTVYQTAGSTTTSLQIITRVITSTVSSAQTATVVATVTISSLLAKREQAILATRTGHVAAQATETARTDSAPTSLVTNELLKPKQNALPPQITSRPIVPDTGSIVRPKRKRTVTSTRYSTTRTIYFTSTIDFTSRASFLATITSSTTIWQTTTTFINAQATVRTTVTTNIADSRPPSPSPTPVITNDNNNNGRGGGGGGGLTRGAQIGIGVGTAGGSLIICIILGFFLARRSKQRKLKNQALIESAVAAAMAGGSQQSPQQHDKTRNFVHSPEPYAMSTLSNTTYATDPQSQMMHKPELHGMSAPVYPPIHNPGSQPGQGRPRYYQFNQPESYQAYAPGVYQAYSPEMPASPIQPIQDPHELPGQPGSPPPIAPQGQYGYLPQGHGYPR